MATETRPTAARGRPGVALSEGGPDVSPRIIDLGESASPDDVARFQRIWDQARRSVEAGRVDRGPDLWAFFIAGFWILLGISVAMIVVGASQESVMLLEAVAFALVLVAIRVRKGV